MSLLQTLKSASDLQDVATILGFKAKGLSYVLYKIHPTAKYHQFEIPKKHGGTRQISAPTDKLKLVQQRLADLLQNCMEEINTAHGLEDRISHGFKRGRSILTNARQHRNRRYVFNVDLENFFGTVNFGRVRGFFIKDHRFALHQDVATVLAQIACHNNALPQGSPCSPVISNLVGHILDVHLARLAATTGCTYSRYADDLTFSTNKKEFPPSIATHSLNKPHVWTVGPTLGHLITKSGFEVNLAKVRMQYKASRQEVTGLVVNKKLNVRKEYRHTVRAMTHRLLMTGQFHFSRQVKDETGNVTVVSEAGTTNQLHGMLGFVDGVDLDNEKLRPKSEKRSSKAQALKETMYRRFLLFTQFYNPPTPVIICEGKTDNIYLLHAIRALAKQYPQLATVSAKDGIQLRVRIYKYSGTSTGRILGIQGGGSQLANLMRLYDREVKRFKAPGKKFPLVLLFDNDEGAEPIYNTIKDLTGSKASKTEQFIHVAANMYALPTPLPHGMKESKIEDFFDDAAKNVAIGGKKFNPASDVDSDLFYGKMVFAHKVVAASPESINFDAFKLILDNLSALLEAHAKKFPS